MKFFWISVPTIRPFVFLGWIVVISSGAQAAPLSPACVPVSLVQAATSFGQPTTVRMVNQCGQCANVSWNVFANGTAVDVVRTFINVQPGDQRQVAFTAHTAGTTELRVTNVLQCH